MADDFIEPFRPIVDIWTKENIAEECELTKDDRINLVNLLNYECVIDSKNHSILNAIDVCISSYISSLNNKDYNLLKLPEIKPLTYHNYE